ncbi:hypothetical protein [Robiginitalea sp. SC105]|uniref:hypothetical protein n=1 Tax=Robiginitalea sp. SC105 TaxID=2762332 RepID=UPI001639DF7C|nr:hypothetical protein [Robiginitalea sp. SC105]MBC2838789.1 hypothetical protein [Robiginitalea sp. SC105]
MKKKFVLTVLFILPLVVYMFFASGVTNFGRLPVLSGPVPELDTFEGGQRLKDRITVMGFLGDSIGIRQGQLFNLNQKIYKRFYEFRDFQMLMVAPEGSREEVEAVMKELETFTDTRNWHFAYGPPAEIQAYFDRLGTGLSLDATGGSPYVFIIDKDRMLRGRKKDEDTGIKFGFDATSVADLNNKMEDDMKIILAEYRLALKSNQAGRNNE